jgi:hypothetical protein
MKKIICVLVIFSLIFVPVAKINAQSLDTKTCGKLSLIILLTSIAVLTKLLVNKDKKKTEELHSRIGLPDKILEFQKGFDNWRIEWYDEKGYLFRNGVLQNEAISTQ